MAEKKPAEDTTSAQEQTAPSIRWDDRNLKTDYANVCNVSSTREEVTLLFGTNQTWHSWQEGITVHLSDRVILSPFAAKRLAVLLGNVVGEYERRFGPLPLEVPQETGVK